jgi:hypothetical protein
VSEILFLELPVILRCLGDILLGIPARIMPFVLPGDDRLSTATMTKQLTKQTLIDNIQSMWMDFFNILLVALCFTLSLKIAFSFNLFLLTVPIFLFIYSSTVHVVYAHLMNIKSNQIENSQSFDEVEPDWRATLAMTLYTHYTKWTGCLLGGTQWLVFVLRRFGAQIGDDVVIDDMNTMYDVHLITIGSHTRLSATSQIQVCDFLLIIAVRHNFFLNSVTPSNNVISNVDPSHSVQLVFYSQCQLCYLVLHSWVIIIWRHVPLLFPTINLRHTPTGLARQQNVLLFIMVLNHHS